MSKYTFIVAVHAFFLKDDKVLLLERKDTGYMDGFYSVPAGHVDGGETIVDAMKREIFEETGITSMKDIQPVHVMHRTTGDGPERIDYFFSIRDWNGEVQNTEPHKCKDLIWADANSLPGNVIPYIKFALEHVKDKTVFSEYSDS